MPGWLLSVTAAGPALDELPLISHMTLSVLACAGMHRAQHLAAARGHLHLPSKSTVITVVILLHVLAMSYLLYALYTAHRCFRPPLLL